MVSQFKNLLNFYYFTFIDYASRFCDWNTAGTAQHIIKAISESPT